MSQLDKFLDGADEGAFARRDRRALARQTSAEKSVAAGGLHRAQLAHRAALVRQNQIAERGERAVRNTAEIVAVGREAADGDAFAGELILETIQLTHRRMNDEI